MAAWPVHPRLAHMILFAQNRGFGRLACDLAALLSERDILAGRTDRSSDITVRLEALEAFRSKGRPGSKSFGADPAACQRVDQAARQLYRLLQSRAPEMAPDLEPVGLLLSFAYPDRIAQQREPKGVRYRLSSGRGARLPRDEQRMRPPYLVAGHLDAGESEGTIHLAAGVEIDLLRSEMPGKFRMEDTVRWDPRLDRIVAQREVRLGELLIQSGPIPDPDPERFREAVLDGIRTLGITALPWTKDARDFQARLLSMRKWFPEEGWPNLSDAALHDHLQTWLGPHLGTVSRREDLANLNLIEILESQLDWNKKQRLREGAPTHLTVPSGSRLRLDYRPGESPVLAVKLQEMFGLADSPRVAFGKIPVTLHLLSPARRPIQVTQDLRGFWNRTYPEVRKELKGRYPKHPWPDDPWNAVPTARSKRRSTLPHRPPR